MLTTWNEEIHQYVAALNELVKIFWSTNDVVEARPGESYSSYELLCTDGLIFSLSTSKLIHHTPLEAFLQLKSFGDVQQLIIDDLKKQRKFKDKTKEDLQHISFGFLLGYPDAAILAVNPDLTLEDPFHESNISANIRGSGYYTCPRPDYFYPYSLYGHTEIVQNEHLWSNILIDYYTSSFHKELEKDLTFRAKLEELGSM